MVSLSTVYVISIVLTSLAGMGSAFVGNKVYPIQGGAILPPLTPEDVRKATEEAADKARAYAEASSFQKKQAEEEKKEEPNIYASEEPPKEEEKPTSELKQKILEKFQVNDEVGQAITEFVQTPVVDWKKIADTPSDLRRKFVMTMTHPDQNKCPPKLLDLCKIVYVKYSNMISFINDDATYVPYGDQTSEALTLLSNSE